MNEQELRAMVRDSIARHLSPPPPPPLAAHTTHAAFIRLPLVRGGDDDGMCLIEPSVRCTHCGYCQSFGH
jgi:hypothetical protein